MIVKIFLLIYGVGVTVLFMADLVRYLSDDYEVAEWFVLKNFLWFLYLPVKIVFGGMFRLFVSFFNPQ